MSNFACQVYGSCNLQSPNLNICPEHLPLFETNMKSEIT